MVFNSWIFGVFFFFVYLCYLRLPHRGQNIMLLFASWIFYGFWDYRFVLLLWASTVIDYLVAWGLSQNSSQQKRRTLLVVSICVNLGILGFFKYCDFFIQSTAELLMALGFNVSLHTLGIIVPVGISFYTFQSLGYIISVYRGEVKACRSPLDYALFVSFFPQLVAGPIERAAHLIGQIQSQRVITIAGIQSGLWLILKGFFLKVFVADNLAKMVTPVFETTDAVGMAVLLGIYAFAFQIYGDFAGYSNIARGISRLMGFDLMVNFKAPYFALNPSDFWRRWHISLSGWLRDYLYIPLGGNRKGTTRTNINLLLTMFLGGLWHGAAWTYVGWGIYQGLLLVVYRLIPRLDEWSSSCWIKAGQRICYFHLVCFGWLIFRARNFNQVDSVWSRLFAGWHWDLALSYQIVALLCLVLPVVLLDVIEERSGNSNVLSVRQPVLRRLIYIGLFLLIYILGNRGGTPFIYFQF